MFWLFVVWVGVVTVASMMISTALTGGPFPGGWGRSADDRRGPHGPTHKPAFAGRTP